MLTHPVPNDHACSISDKGPELTVRTGTSDIMVHNVALAAILTWVVVRITAGVL